MALNHLVGMMVFLLGAMHSGISKAEAMSERPMQKNESLTGCSPVNIIEPTKHQPRGFMISGPGHYCLMEDLFFTYNPLVPLSILASGSGGFGTLAPGVVLDLGGHTLRSNYNGVSGIFATGDRSGLLKPIVIKNGAIRLSGGNAIKVKNTYSYLWYDKPYEVLPKNVPGATGLYQAARDGYISTRVTLENLDITVGNTAIFLEGNDNIIRNCKIRVKPGGNAIQIFGSNVQILNNEIIVEANARDAYADEKMWAEARLSIAPIMIRDGDNSLISGNKITIKGTEANRPVQAITLRDSRNVRIENNKVIGAQVIYKTLEAFNVESTATESNNSLKTKTGWFD